MLFLFKKLHSYVTRRFYLVLIISIACVHTPYVRGEIEFNHLLILGIGGKMGAEYKRYIFEKVRPYAKNIYACDIRLCLEPRKMVSTTFPFKT